VIEFKDYSKMVLDKLHEESVAWLEEASGAIESQTKRNTKVDTGKTKGSWEHTVNEDKLEAEVGSRYINALYEELGTGIYALNGDGRKTKWVYTPDGKHFYTTVGKKPRRALYNAFTSLKNKLIHSAQTRFKNL
jgi:hypothetical protein